MIYHIASIHDWNQHIDTNEYFPDRFAEEGFIHASTIFQIQRIADRIFKNHDEIILLAIDESKEKDFITYENLEGGDELFPHIYRKLPKSSIVQLYHLFKTIDGDFDLSFLE